MYECTQCGAESLTAPRGNYGNQPLICLECAYDNRHVLNEYYELTPSTRTQNGG